ncbi:MAG: hypothetical protein KatS3mg131_1333 [Candidatus Tectimicrobiota bacterium]|nr:MAG: hypothetical protein KatS3mg131_1333 [Candidatus Tectomicrobia bacterium]
MSRPLVELRRVTAGYDRQPLWRALDFALWPGQFAALVGPTGAGKSALLKVLVGLLPVMTGSVQRAPHLAIGYVPQGEAIDGHLPLTVEQMVCLGGYRQTRPWPWFNKQERRQAAAWLERLGLGAYRGRHLSQLSGGQQQRVLLARALMGQPQLLVLDEPTTGVDLHTQHTILHLLRDLHGEGLSVLLASHDLNTVASHVPWLVCFNRGLVAQGPAWHRAHPGGAAPDLSRRHGGGAPRGANPGGQPHAGPPPRQRRAAGSRRWHPCLNPCTTAFSFTACWLPCW